MSRRPAYILVVFVVLTVPACGDSQGGASVEPKPSSSAVPSTPSTDGAPPTSIVVQSATQGTVVVAPTDEVYLDRSSGQLIHRDSDGVYICLLLRPDDLASYRPSYAKSLDVQESLP